MCWMRCYPTSTAARSPAGTFRTISCAEGIRNAEKTPGFGGKAMSDVSPLLTSKRPMPREIGSGVWWLGDCLGQLYNGKIYHGYNAAHMVVGTTAALLSDTGHPKDFPVIEKHIEHVLARYP